MGRHRVGIVIPALNEAATIAGVVRGASKHGVPIVVDDGSRDDTGKRAATAGADVVSHKETRGYDCALNTGFERANQVNCEYVATLDADGQHVPSLLVGFVQALDAGADVVIGVRTGKQRVAETVFAWVTTRKWGIRDPLCGLKAYRIDVWKELGHFDSYGSIGTELTLFAAARDKNLAQLEIRTRQRRGAPRFGSGLSANLRILRSLIHGIRKQRIWARRPMPDEPVAADD